MLLKGILKTDCAKTRYFESIGSKYGVCCTRYQNFGKFGTGRGKRESSKNWIFRCFPKLNTISLRDY